MKLLEHDRPAIEDAALSPFEERYQAMRGQLGEDTMTGKRIEQGFANRLN